MSTKSHLIFLFLFLVALAFILVSRRSVHQLEEAVRQEAQKESVLENYILSSFNATTLQDKALISESCQSRLNDTDVIAYLPSGLCHACFSSLLFALQDHGIPGNRVTVICEKEDYEARSECRARGINYLVESLPIESISDILVFRLYRGFLPIVMEYDLKRKSLLPLFLSDNENLLHILTGSD